uniref:Probable ATP-dependent transporter ycf16 n=1 Tax=Rhodosorus marinus TaxID=101924 RepID=A0A7S3EFB3_9RHOD|mmetsp:Transcript_27883/g.109406  ORF Transcript_27883/g.109406 Transcript_27883/m.109406 type:complete len:631 (+) Transcript_27883:83-1975(+)|eukprot:CAMPEP_0113965272 /NCGR_PEP_ID=MMETSP0011_2-20120614/7650_1 /TAXON_ID=101924 /ORGANISM="Rhodosorus marinus" /LENGTH=630 /DNA_ID=CAMNT_0000977761 /DNA_START=49 /DNA_END=1941 /DNA_ORIENTATION=+ /assembly_acc=CAM_ASM_000156
MADVADPVDGVLKEMDVDEKVVDVEMGNGHGDDVFQTTMSTMLEPVHLRWEDLTYAIKGKKAKQILHPMSGDVKPGQMLAIMGSSGAGKTTLLNLLAGRLSSSKNVATGGNVLVNGSPRDFKTFGKYAAYVEQSDNMFETLTVQEQIRFSADLRLPKKVGKERRRIKAEEIINELGLRNVKESKIGGESVRGVSGGEKRRVNIGTELVTSPSLIFLDEPTSGLDSFNALNVMQSLRNLAERGRTIVTTIHQPRSNIFKLFDQLLLLSKGEVVYFGPANEAVAYFSKLGHPCPPEYNPADFMIDLISADSRTTEREEETNERIQMLASTYLESTEADPMLDDFEEPDALGTKQDGKFSKYNSSWTKELAYLLKRSLILMKRDTAQNITRVGISVVMGVLLGLIWLGVGYDYWADPGPDRLNALIGVLAFVAINESFNGAFAILFVFPMERTIVLRERASRMYRVSSYFVARTLVEIPRTILVVLIFTSINYFIVGFRVDAGAFFEYSLIVFLIAWASESMTICISTFAKDAQVASSIVPVFIILAFLFSDFLIDLDLVPVWLAWLQYLSWIKYGLTLIMYSQFSGQPGEEIVLGRYGNVSRGAAYGGLIGCTVVLRALGYLFLRINKPKKS